MTESTRRVDLHFPPPSGSGDGFSIDLLVWTALQAGLIALTAGGISLSAHFTLPVDSVAVTTMAVGQALLIGLIGPRICRFSSGFFQGAASIWVFLSLSARLAGRDFHDIWAIGTWLSALLAVVWLATGGRGISGNHLYEKYLRFSGVALLLAMTTIAPVLRYLRADFSDTGENCLAHFDLLAGVVDVTTRKSLVFSDGFLFVPLVLLGFARLVARFVQSHRQLIHNFLT